MQITSALWKAYQALPSKKYTYKVMIDTEEYLNTDIFSINQELNLCSDSVFMIGNVFSRKLSISIKPKAAVIPKMANVDVYIRMEGPEGPTEWLQQGKFFIDTRKKAGLAIALECFDKVLMMESPFVIEGEELVYPMLMSDAVEVISNRLNITCVNPGLIQPGFYIEYPNELTMREVLGYIGDANGGNFILNDEGNLKLVIPENNAPVAIGSYGKLYDENEIQTFDKLIMYYDDTNGFESGTGSNEFVDTNIWATQPIADHVLSKLINYIHRPYSATKVYLDPAIELGDTISLGGNNYVLFNATINYSAGIVYQISAPGETEINHEYPYVGTYTKALKNKITLGASYYGNKWTRENGYTCEKSDGSSKLILNSDLLSWQVKVMGEMIDRLYFDAVAGDLKYNGKFGVEAIEALKAEIDIVVSNITITNILSAQTANIAELTVDRIETSDKVQKYVQTIVDKSDVDYWRGMDQFIRFITAEYVGDIGGVLQTENVYDRFGNQLFWLDEVHSGITDDGAAHPNYPVKQLKYNELVKLEIAFEEIDGVKQPYFALGAGYGSSLYPDRGKFFIRKSSNGAKLAFIKNDGTEVAIEFSEDGLIGAGGSSEKLSSLAFYANGFVAVYGSDTVGYRWTTDGLGRITQLENLYESEIVPISWNGGNV